VTKTLWGRARSRALLEWRISNWRILPRFLNLGRIYLVSLSFLLPMWPIGLCGCIWQFGYKWQRSSWTFASLVCQWVRLFSPIDLWLLPPSQPESDWFLSSSIERHKAQLRSYSCVESPNRFPLVWISGLCAHCVYLFVCPYLSANYHTRGHSTWRFTSSSLCLVTLSHQAWGHRERERERLTLICITQTIDHLSWQALNGSAGLALVVTQNLVSTSHILEWRMQNLNEYCMKLWLITR